MLSFHVKFVQTDGQTDGKTSVKQYAPDLLIRRHKNMAKVKVFADKQTDRQTNGSKTICPGSIDAGA